MSEDAHNVSVSELCTRYGTNIEKGLTSEQAKAGLEKHGPNKINDPVETPVIVTFCQGIFNNIILLPWIAAIICFVIYGVSSDCLYIGIFLCLAGAAVSVFLFIKEVKEKWAITTAREAALEPKLQVLRDGQQVEVRKTQITIGDIVILESCDTVPADMRIFKSDGLMVDKSSLTGESNPQNVGPELTHENPLETQNLVLGSTKVTHGSGIGVVFAVGMKTVSGRISGLASTLEAGQSLFDVYISQVITYLRITALAIGIIVFFLAFIFGYHWVDCFLCISAVILASLPLGLPAELAFCRKIAHQRLEEKKCILKSNEALEVLPTVNTICTGKTGIFTENKLTVAHLWFNNKLVEVKEEEHKSGNAALDRDTIGWKELERASRLCNTAKFKLKANNDSSADNNVTGDPIDAAIMKYNVLFKDNIPAYRSNNERVFGRFGYSSFNSFISFKTLFSIHKSEQGGGLQHIFLVKSDPEIILDMCSTILVDGKAKPIEEKMKNEIEATCQKLRERGERVVAYSELLLPTDKYPMGYNFESDEFDEMYENLSKGILRFVGMISLVDPIRKDLASAVSRCREAGVKVVMLTEDNAITAQLVAKEVGILTGDQEKALDKLMVRSTIVTQKQIRNLQDLNDYHEIVVAEFDDNFIGTVMNITERFQNSGNVVAFIGEEKSLRPDQNLSSLYTSNLGVVMR